MFPMYRTKPKSLDTAPVVTLTLRAYDDEAIQATVNIQRGAGFTNTSWLEPKDGELGQMFADFVGEDGVVELGAMLSAEAMAQMPCCN